MGKLNLFELAELQLIREGKNNFTDKELLSRAVTIRKWLDLHRQKTAEAIMQGQEVYQYGNTIKTYARI